MALEDILRALDKKAEAEITAILDGAQHRVDEIKSEIEQSAARARRLKLKKIEDSIRSEAAAVVYSASLKAKNSVIEAEKDVVDSAFNAAEKKLHEISKEESYPKILEVLIDGCLEYLKGDVVIQTRPQDRELIEKIMASKGINFKFSDTPLEASGGLIAQSPNGDIVVYNTFESRMDRARESLKLEISKTLFESP